MPDKAVHLSQARHNHEFFHTIDLDAYPDWALTVLFYAAVHYIDSKLAESAIHPDHHSSRDTHVANHPVLANAYDEYRKMKTDSFNARFYPPFRKPKAYIDIAHTIWLGRILGLVA